MKSTKPIALLLFSLQLCLAPTVSAGGFAILEQSAEGVGTAFAGSVTGFGDGSSAFFNPAALTQIQQTTLSAGVHAIITSAEFDNQGSSVVGFPNTGPNGPDGGDTGIVPNIYVIEPLSDKLVAGFMLNAPFGLKTEYDRAWVGRYQGVKSELTVLNLSTALGYKVNDRFSVGGRVGAYYSTAELSNAIDFGTIAVSSLGATTAGALGLSPQSADGFAAAEGDDWSPAWGLGASFSYGDNNRNLIGLSFSSKSDVHIHGDQAKFEVPTSAIALTSMGAFTDTGVRANTTLPESVTFGVSHWLSDCIELLYESQWTRWSRFKELRLTYDNPAQADTVVEQAWTNSWRHSLGLRFLPGNAWEFRGGITHDEEPIPDAEHRTPRIPGNDRFWVALGMGYQINDDLKFSLNYAHLFVDDASSATVGTTGDSFVGEWDLGVDIVSASLTYRLS